MKAGAITEGILSSNLSINDWLVHSDMNVLSRLERRARVEPKAMQVLLYLAARANEVVSKQDLKAHVWAGTFVSDDVLIRCICELRKVLEDDSRLPTVIQTINRGGYRLTASLIARESTTPARFETERPPESLTRNGSPWPGLMKGAALAAALFLGARTVGLWPFGGRRVSNLAVLPFRNLSGDARQDFFAAAMTDRLTSDLSDLPSLRVTPTTSVARYALTTVPIREIARELNLDLVVEGSVMPVDSRVTINAQLVNAHTDQLSWTGAYEGDFTDLLSLRHQVSTRFRDQIGKAL